MVLSKTLAPTKSAEMTIEIRELLIKVKIEEAQQAGATDLEMDQIRSMVIKECKKEISKQLRKYKER